jgi:hypothetical protein
MNFDKKIQDVWVAQLPLVKLMIDGDALVI